MLLSVMIKHKLEFFKRNLFIRKSEKQDIPCLRHILARLLFFGGVIFSKIDYNVQTMQQVKLTIICCVPAFILTFQRIFCEKENHWISENDAVILRSLFRKRWPPGDEAAHKILVNLNLYENSFKDTASRCSSFDVDFLTTPGR